MFILPILLVPLVFGLAIHRLVDVPRQLSRGTLRLLQEQQQVPSPDISP